jgi:hypothetical protein
VVVVQPFRAAIAVVVLVLGLCAPMQAAAQTTRAEELRQEREKKARTLQPVKRNRVEGVLFKLENSLILERLLNPPRGVHLRIGGIGEGAGFGAGPGFRYQTDRLDFRTSAAGSLKRYAIGEASLLLPGIERDGPWFEVYARRRNFPQEDFFGLGPQSAREDRSNFSLRDSVLRATAGARRGRLVGGAAVSYLDAVATPGTDKRMPSADDVFAPAEMPGFNERPAFVVFEPFVEYQNTDHPLNPWAGGRYRVSFSRYSDRELERFSFNRWNADVRQYIPFFHATRTIALRLSLASTDPGDGNDVPFYLQPTLGGAYSLRGFPTFRFRDRSAALVQAEYRWRVNEFVTGALFYDTGAVGRGLGDLGDFERDFGFGLRVGSRAGVVLRTDLVFGSGEGTRLLIRFDNVF